MSAAVGRWLARGRTGASSEALAAAALGVLPDTAPAYPHDSDDFGRCVTLWAMAPQAADGLKKLAEISGPWNRLALRWNELLVLYETDLRACNKLIRELTSSVTGLYYVRKGPDGRWDAFKERA